MKLVVSGLSLDIHAWNLMALQVILERMGFEVVNLGIRVPPEQLLAAVRRERPDCLVLSTMSGHYGMDAARLIARIRADGELAGLLVVIGGLLESPTRLHQLGFDAVFPAGPGREGDAVAALRQYLSTQFAAAAAGF